MTLVEVVAGLALLGTLLVALLSARAKVTRQYQGAEARLEAVKVAEELLAGWWREVGRFPRNDVGQVGEGVSRFVWRTRVIPNQAMEELSSEVVRLELSRPGVQRVVLAVDVVLPRSPVINVPSAK